ncbi:hypothetical protein [Gimesia aquarii]|nr:hypothetical protein [Gimesia aquarii]
MKIIRILAHRVELPLKEGSYKWSGGKSISVIDSTIIGVETDTRLAMQHAARAANQYSNLKQ